MEAGAAGAMTECRELRQMRAPNRVLRQQGCHCSTCTILLSCWCRASQRLRRPPWCSYYP
eukprot:5366706-Pleurochrysis_carterae.AAC.2